MQFEVHDYIRGLNNKQKSKSNNKEGIQKFIKAQQIKVCNQKESSFLFNCTTLYSSSLTMGNRS